MLEDMGKVEKWLVKITFLGLILLSSGFLLSVIEGKMGTLVLIFGSVVSFLSTVVLVIYEFVKG